MYDEAQIRQQMRRYHSAFQQNDIGYVLSYASKAFTCLQMVKLAAEEDSNWTSYQRENFTQH